MSDRTEHGEPMIIPMTDRDALREIQRITDLGWHKDAKPEDIVSQVRWLRGDHAAICETLQACVQRHHLGLGGERIDKLVCDQLDFLMESRQ
jgi:hypothetical protein